MKYLIRTARPIMEDMLGTLTFYLLFVMTGSALLAALIGLAISLCQALLHKMKGEPVPGLLLLGIALTITLGALSIWTHSARFLLLKPSIIYSCIGFAMLPRGWVNRYVPEIALDLLPSATWDRVGRAWAWLMLATAAGNVLLVALLPPHRAAVVLLVVATSLKLILFSAQYGILRTRAAAAHRARLSS